MARGEDPLRPLAEKVEQTGSSSFVEIWWRKARGKEKTRAGEKEVRERRGEVGLLEGEEGGQAGGRSGSGTGEEGGRGRGKWHDRLRWGI